MAKLTISIPELTLSPVGGIDGSNQRNVQSCLCISRDLNNREHVSNAVTQPGKGIITCEVPDDQVETEIAYVRRKMEEVQFKGDVTVEHNDTADAPTE